MTMMNNVLTTDGFYFCTDYDLTHTLQRLGNTSPDFQEMSLLERVRRKNCPCADGLHNNCVFNCMTHQIPLILDFKKNPLDAACSFNWKM